MKKFLVNFLTLFCLIFSIIIPVQAEGDFKKSSEQKEIIEVEQNGSIDTSNPVLTSQDVVGGFTDHEDVDYFKFEMPYSGTYELFSYLGNDSYDNQTLADTYRIKIYDQDGQEVTASAYYDYYDEETSEYSYWQWLTVQLPKGTYYLSVQGDSEYYDLTDQQYIIYQTVQWNADFSIEFFTSDIKSPTVTGKTITFTANANADDLQYQFSVNDRVVQAFGVSPSYSWKPSKPGKYTIKVEARKAGHPDVITSKTLSYEIKDANVSVTSLTKSKTSPSPTSSTIKWTAKGKGEALEYKFSVGRNGKWTTLQDYSSKNYVNWKPKTAGSYKVRVTVRSKLSGKTASKESSYTIYKPSSYSITSFKVNYKSPQKQGKKIKFSAQAKGSYLEYRFRVYKGSKWYTVQDYSSKKTFDWQPFSSGKYKIAIDVRQKGSSSKKSKYLSYDIKATPSVQVQYYFNMTHNYGYMVVTNYGSKSLKVNKIEFKNGNKTLYSYSPNNWTTSANNNKTFNFNPKKSVTGFSWGTVFKVHYTYDGLKYTLDIYRDY